MGERDKTDSADLEPHWDENISEQYLDYGKYFVPAREQQMKIIIDLLKGRPQPGRVLELCCGEGLLAEQILDAFPETSYLGLDGSSLMISQASQRLSRFSDRAKCAAFELADLSWRKIDQFFQAVLSTMAIHHLDGKGKQRLFKDVHAMLGMGGLFIISDMVDPVTPVGRLVAADAWDDVVRQRSIELDGGPAGLEFFQREHWNTYRYPDPDDIDHPSPLFDQLKWLEQAGFINIDVHFLQAGHALFSGMKTAA